MSGSSSRYRQNSYSWAPYVILLLLQGSNGAAAAATIGLWQQCGGKGDSGSGRCGRPGYGPCVDAAWTSPTCKAGSRCVRDNMWWWQCEPGAPQTVCKSYAGYTVQADVDRSRDDIGNYGANAAQKCTDSPSCKGFNSNGWIKRSVTPTVAAKGACLYTKTGGGGDSNGCPAGWSKAVGTLYDSWPKPGTKECIDYNGCQWAGQFNNIDCGGGSPDSCMNGARWLDGGNGNMDCRFPESTVKGWNIASTYQLDKALLGRQLQIMVEGKPGVVTTVNVLDVCSDSDCESCCKTNTGNKKWKLIDIEKWPASKLLGFDPTRSSFDINDVSTPSANGLRPGAPNFVMPLCYKDVGPAARVV